MAQDGKLTYEQLCDLAVDWCQAWCQRDLDRIMSHYTDDVALNSPNVVSRLGHADGWVRGAAAVRAYFAQGLEAAPDLRFLFVDLLMGAGHVTILYRRETGALVTDTLEIDGQGRGRRVVACYGAKL